MNSTSFLISPEKLKHWYEKGFVVPLACSVPCPSDPWQIARRVLEREENAFFLDSVRPQGGTARYSCLGWNPFRIFRLPQMNGDSNGSSSGVVSRLRNLFHPYRGRRWPELPFFTGGAVGYFSYELRRAFEHLPSRAADDLELDSAVLLFVRDFLVFDLKDRKCFVISNLIPSLDGTFQEALARARRAVEKCRGAVAAPDSNGRGNPAPTEIYPPPAFSGGIVIRNFRADISKRAFKRMILRAKRYIEAGDIYQANLSQRFSFDFKGSPELLYESLRRINPSPFSSFLKIGPLVAASSSPERLIQLKGDRCETRPIAGTRPRGETPVQEHRLRRDLIMSPKERAEHIMLVDLERNDLGRVSRAHSVRVSELMTLERYSHVTHIVSNIVGRLRKGCDRFDLLRAVFPGGTITGCPKIRSMEIIDELEPFKRHLYTGSIGWLDFNGDMDLNIVIRSFILHRNRGHLQAGAGIVYDSDPEAEYWETLHKGKALIDALCEAGRDSGNITRNSRGRPCVCP